MPIVATSILALSALVGAWLDLASRRLPNWLCLATAVAGLAFAGFAAGAGALLSPLVHASLALLVGMVLFRLGWIGGGDAKFYAACAAWFPLHQAFALVLWVSLAGLVLVAVWFGYRQATHKRRAGEQAHFASVPYGVAVAAGAVVAWVLVS